MENLKRQPGVFRDLTGHRFGQLVVLRRAPDYRKGQTISVRWECQCDCGNITVVHRGTLIEGHTKSCGCLKSVPGSKSKCWEGYGQISGALWGNIKRAAKRRSIPLDISLEEAWAQFEAQGGKCALSGIPLIFTSCYSSRKTETTASLDRIDSSKGYTRDNIQWVHKKLQAIKSDMPQEEFLIWCRRINAAMPHA